MAQINDGFLLAVLITLVMDTQRCLEILGLKSVTSIKELKQAYRDLVQIWHPDRFNNNRRLEQIAEEKLRDINIAYNHLLTYFDPNQSKLKRTSVTDWQADPKDPDPKFDNGSQPSNSFGPNYRSEGGQFGQYTGIKIYSTRKKSLIRKWVLRAFFCILFIVGGSIIYLSLYMDQIVVKSKGLASEAMEKMTEKLEQNESIQKNAPSVPRIMEDLSKELKPQEPKNQFDIYLDSGSIINTESWWEENNMIMYKKHGGSMGIEKDRVKKIVKR